MTMQVRLAKASIEKLEPPARGRLYVRDSEVRHLRLQITPRGTPTFQSYRKISGRPVRIVLGLFDPAVAEARNLPSDVRDGDTAAAFVVKRPRLNVRMARELVRLLASASVRPSELKRTRSSSPTVAAILADYERLHLVPNCKAGAVDRIKWARQRVEQRWGATKVTDLAHEPVARWHAELVADVGAHSANRAYEVLRAAVGWFLPKGAANPAAGVEKATEKSRTRFLLAHEVAGFFTELQLIDQPWRDLFTLLVLVGARRGAVQAMQWRDVEFGAAIWHMPAADAKNDEPTTIVLVPQAIEVLRRREHDRPAGTPFVFPSDSKSGHVESPKKAWALLIDRLHRRQLVADLARAKVKHPKDATRDALIALAKKHKVDCPRPDLRPHDLRRSLGSWMAGGNTSLQIVGKALGHKSQQSTEVYARLQVDAVREAQTAAVDRLMSAANVVDIRRKKVA